MDSNNKGLPVGFQWLGGTKNAPSGGAGAAGTPFGSLEGGSLLGSTLGSELEAKPSAAAVPGGEPTIPLWSSTLISIMRQVLSELTLMRKLLEEEDSETEMMPDSAPTWGLSGLKRNRL